MKVDLMGRFTEMEGRLQRRIDSQGAAVNRRITMLENALRANGTLKDDVIELLDDEEVEVKVELPSDDELDLY